MILFLIKFYQNRMVHHLLFIIISGWFLSAYVLQPFPANAIAFFLIILFSVISCTKPDWGAILAVFFLPLTLSLGRHLTSFLGENAPPYLPYGEIIFLAILLGWIFHTLSFERKSSELHQQVNTRSPQDNLVLLCIAFWTALALLGIFPAVVRNIQISPALPLQVWMIKILFSPVLGLADPLYPLTIALRMIIALGFCYYAQLLRNRSQIIEPVICAFMISMGLCVIYAMIQSITLIGFIRIGDPTSYAQGFFHDNESFASFCLVSLVMSLLQQNKSRSLLYLMLKWLFQGLMIIGIIISSSRAIMLLSMLTVIALFLFFIRYYRSLLRISWIQGTAVLLLVIFIGFFFQVSSFDLKKISRMVTSEEYFQKKRDIEYTLNKEGFTTLGQRLDLWKSAVRMVVHSAGLGMGTGTYYSLTGYQPYQAIHMKENAHFFWLQQTAELGVIFGIIPLLFFLISICFFTYYPSSNTFPYGIHIFLWCNIAGQSLLQNEVLWFFSFIVGLTFYGEYPHHLQFLKKYMVLPKKNRNIILGISLLVYCGSWSAQAYTLSNINTVIPEITSYGYGFDLNGHRFLNTGLCYSEYLYIQKFKKKLEFRISPAGQIVDKLNPLQIKIILLNSERDILKTQNYFLASGEYISSLIVELEDLNPQVIQAIISVKSGVFTGNLIHSEKRIILGCRYYGFRLRCGKF